MSETRAMEGKTVLITGASSGIGRATAVGLARMGARLLLVGRTPERCEEALAAVRGAGASDVEMLTADFASLAGVRELADSVLARAERLDVLLNNAGVTRVRRTVTPDGFESTFAINHLAYFLLTGLLLPRLRESAPARIVSVASDAHKFGGRIDLDDLQNERSYSGLRVYGQSKAANILWNAELARRIEATGVTANCLHPGGVRTNLGSGSGPVLDAVQRLIGLFLKSPEKGAETSIYLASSPDVEGRSGGYYANRRPHQAARHATNPETARRLWEISESLVEFRYP